MKSISYILVVAAFILMPMKQIFAQEITSKSPVYMEVISTPDKSINLILGLYPETYQNSSSDYCYMTLRVLNQATTSFTWDDYKIYIMLNDNTLFYNYKTQASSGGFNCKYTVEGNSGSNDQKVCFSKKFNYNDIAKAWVSFGDDKFFNLVFYNGGN